MMLMSIKSHARMVGIPAYVESIAKFMAVASTPRPRHKPRILNSHPFLDNILAECNDVERCFEDGERMEEDADIHDTST